MHIPLFRSIRNLLSKRILGWSVLAFLLLSLATPAPAAWSASPVVTSFADPGVQFQSTNLTSPTMRTVTFNETATFGGSTANPISGTVSLAGIGTLSGTGSVYRNDYVWGGAGGVGGFPQAGDLLFTLNTTQRYVGFWWSAGNRDNTVTLLNSSGATLGSFTTADLLTALGGSCGGATEAIDPYCGNPNTSADPTRASANEPYAYINIRFADGFQKVRFSGAGFEFDNVSFSETVPPRVSTETTVTLTEPRASCNGVTSSQANAHAYACPKTISIARGASFAYSPLANSGITGYSYPAGANLSDAYIFEGVGELVQSGNSVTLSSAETGTYVANYTVSVNGETDTSTITVSVLDAAGTAATTIPVDPRNTSVRLPTAAITGSDEVVLCIHTVTDATGTTEVASPSIRITSPTSVGGVTVINSGSFWRSRASRSAISSQLQALRITSEQSGTPVVPSSPIYLRVRFAPGVSAGSNQCVGGTASVLTLFPLEIAGMSDGGTIPLG